MDFGGIFERMSRLVTSIDFNASINILNGLTPADFYENLLLGVPTLAIILVLFLFRAYRILALLVGAFALWSAKVYFIPENGEEIPLTKLISFAITSLFVGVMWIYVFFIKGD